MAYSGGPSDKDVKRLKDFFIKKSELTLKYTNGPAMRLMAFSKTNLPREEWRERTKRKFAELLGMPSMHPTYESVTELRKMDMEGVTIHALVMQIDNTLSIPAYLLVPDNPKTVKIPVMAIHGHGDVEPSIGSMDEYHHYYALELAKDGHTVLAPELRGFSTLGDLDDGIPVDRLDYWVNGTNFTAVTDAFLYGKTLVGETVEDLLRWENWFANTENFDQLDVTGISYGGDLSIYYPVFSHRVHRIFASGTFGSFTLIYKKCHNAPAHGIPHVLKWMDRADIAGLNAPTPIMFHYGAYDTTSATNASAAYNGSVPEALKELKVIYKAFGAPDNAIQEYVSQGKHHEYDIPKLLEYLDE